MCQLCSRLAHGHVFTKGGAAGPGVRDSLSVPSATNMNPGDEKTSDVLGFHEIEARLSINRLPMELPRSVPDVTLDNLISSKVVEMSSRPPPADPSSIPPPRFVRPNHSPPTVSDDNDATPAMVWKWFEAGPLTYGAVILLVGLGIGWVCENLRTDL
ncbi:hypothetical protein BC628DRAFT_1379474 [Trametes gibbosa]|nr:hypothetical protein BC628DRAFT_1379474 [Trametes gibbosa]